MKISELISELSNCLKVNGDLEVKIDSARGEYGEESIAGVVPTRAGEYGDKYPKFTGQKYLLITSDNHDAESAKVIEINS